MFSIAFFPMSLGRDIRLLRDNGDDDAALISENLHPTTSSNNSEVRNKITTD